MTRPPFHSSGRQGTETLYGDTGQLDSIGHAASKVIASLTVLYPDGTKADGATALLRKLNKHRNDR